MRRAWTVSQATSISEVYSISVQRTYMGESLPESLPGLGEPGQDLRVVSRWTLNDALKIPYSPLGMPKALGMRPWWGQRDSRRGRGPRWCCHFFVFPLMEKVIFRDDGKGDV